jgi:hypothetical protein
MARELLSHGVRLVGVLHGAHRSDPATALPVTASGTAWPAGPWSL